MGDLYTKARVGHEELGSARIDTGAKFLIASLSGVLFDFRMDRVQFQNANRIIITGNTPLSRFQR